MPGSTLTSMEPLCSKSLKSVHWCSPYLYLHPSTFYWPQLSTYPFVVFIVQLLSRVWLCEPMNCSTPGFPLLHYFLEFAQTHIHWVGDATQPSHPLSPPSPPAFSLSQHQGLFQEVSSSHQVAKVLEFSFSISPSNKHSGLISFRIDWFELQGLSRISSSTTVLKASVLWHSAFFTVQLSHPYVTAERTIALTRWTFVCKEMSLLFKTL